MDTIAIEGYINFCKDFDSDDESEKLKAYETYNNYFDILDGCFEAFNIDEGKFSIATELFGGKGFNIFKIVRDAILSAWNWFCRKLKDIKEMIFGSKEKSTQSVEPKSEDLKNEINKKDKEIEELKKQISGYQAQTSKYNKEDQSYQNKISFLENELDKAKSQYDQLLSSYNGSNNTISKQLNSLAKERDNLKSELDNSKSQLNKLLIERDKLKSELSERSNGFNYSELDMYKEENSNMQNEIKTLKDEIDKKDRIIFNIKTHSEEVEREVYKRDARIEKIQRANFAKDDSIEILEERIEKLKNELERVNGDYEHLKENQNNSSTAYSGNDDLKKRIEELEEEKLDLLAELKEEKNNERTDQILIREITKRINQAYEYLTQMITMLFSKIKKSKNLVDDLADGVDISTDKDFTYVTTLNSEYRDLRDKCIEIIIEIEGLASGKLKNTAVLNSHVIRISKYISDIEKNVEKSKNELIDYIDSIERKRISEDKMPLVQKMMETIENMFTQIQSMCIQLMTVRIKEDKEEKNIIKPYIKLSAL